MKFTESAFAVTHRKRHKPLRTLRELAEEFGISYGSLAQRVARDPTAPKEVLHFHQTCGGNKVSFRDRWYNPAEVRRWWKSKQQEKTKC